jgi:hypothetical protein
MKPSVSHDWREEEYLAKVRWFQSLTPQERLEWFCEFTEMLLENNPKLAEGDDVQPVAGRIQILTRPER